MATHSHSGDVIMYIVSLFATSLHRGGRQHSSHCTLISKKKQHGVNQGSFLTLVTEVFPLTIILIILYGNLVESGAF